jgi:hypothetical protein
MFAQSHVEEGAVRVDLAREKHHHRLLVEARLYAFQVGDDVALEARIALFLGHCVDLIQGRYVFLEVFPGLQSVA